MTAPQSHSFDSSEALSLIQHEIAAPHADLSALAFEFSSRGDRVPGRLLRPRAGNGPFALALVLSADDEKQGEFPEDACAWALSGAAVVLIDLPLYGERESSKLSERLQQGLGQKSNSDAPWNILWQEFLIQGASDASRAIDAAIALIDLDTERIVLVASKVATVVVAASADNRSCALALIPGDSEAGSAELQALKQITIPAAIAESKSNLSAALQSSASNPTMKTDIDSYVRQCLGI